jgi:sugar phosphate isomerase/epimerase
VRASRFSVEELLASGIGANLDPSHLFWIVAVIRALGDASYHFHAKDSSVNPHVAAVNGVLDPKPLTDEFNRSWIFRTVGYGHDELTWNNIMSAYEQLVMIQCSASNTKAA